MQLFKQVTAAWNLIVDSAPDSTVAFNGVYLAGVQTRAAMWDAGQAVPGWDSNYPASKAFEAGLQEEGIDPAVSPYREMLETIQSYEHGECDPLLPNELYALVLLDFAVAFKAWHP